MDTIKLKRSLSLPLPARMQYRIPPGYSARLVRMRQHVPYKAVPEQHSWRKCWGVHFNAPPPYAFLMYPVQM